MDTNSDNSENKAYRELAEKIQVLEQRLIRLESSRNLYSGQTYQHEQEEVNFGIKFKEFKETHLESNIGEFGLAWLGNIVLFFGMTFFVQFLLISGFTYLSSAFGFASVAGIFLLSRYFRNSNPYMAKIFNLNGYVLVYFVTLKLHFFNPDPIIANKSIGLALLLLTTAILLALSLRRKHAVCTGLSLILLAITAVVSDSTHIMLPLTTVVSMIAVYLLYRFGWLRLAYLAIFLSYVAFLFWILGNPLMGHQMQPLKYHYFGFVYLYFNAAIFSLIALMPDKKENYTKAGIIGSIIANDIGFILVTGLVILSFFKDHYVLLTGSIALYCLIYSVILQVRSNWKITAALYALFGFVTLSLTFYGLYGLPKAYFLFAIQSLLVVSMAIWFRSKFIVIMNSFMFFILLVGYLVSSPSGNGENISFTLVALATARIINWKRVRLIISTDLIRNYYLITGFIMVLFTLYHLINNSYITLSWSIAAVLYFILSLILKNVKYRYMALGTMIAAAFYLFIVDLARIELVFRVIALLFLALISIGLSFYYSKKLRRKTADEGQV